MFLFRNIICLASPSPHCVFSWWTPLLLKFLKISINQKLVKSRKSYVQNFRRSNHFQSISKLLLIFTLQYQNVNTIICITESQLYHFFVQSYSQTQDSDFNFPFCEQNILTELVVSHAQNKIWNEILNTEKAQVERMFLTVGLKRSFQSLYILAMTELHCWS